MKARPLAVGAVLAWLISAPAIAQTPFTVEDVLTMRGVSVQDASADGNHIVVSFSSLRDRIGIDNYRYGDPTYVAPRTADLQLIDTRTGESRPLFAEKRQVTELSFAPDGGRIAMVVRNDDAFELAIYDVASGGMRTITAPAGRVLDDGSSLDWTADGSRILVTLHSTDWQQSARERFLHEVEGPIVVRSSENPFLSWDEIRRLPNVRIPAVLDVDAGTFQEAMPETHLAGFALTADGGALRYEIDKTEGTVYEGGGRDASLHLRTLDGDQERTLFESTRGMSLRWAEDGRTYLYGRQGAIYIGSIDDEPDAEPRRIIGPDPDEEGGEDEEEAGGAPDSPADSAARAAERERERRERFSIEEVSADAATLIARNSEGYWFVDVETGEREMFFADPEGEDDDEDDTSPNWSIITWSEDGDAVYFEEESQTEWNHAIHLYERSTGEMRELVRGADQYSGIRLSADGTKVIYSRTETNRTGDVWIANADFTEPRRLTDANPQLRQRALGEAQLVDYLDVDGEKQYGVLYLPPDYRQGVRVPTVFLIYEDYFDPRFNSTIALLNANGYAVIQPSVSLEEGYPGEGWLKGVTAAANKLIEMGIADPDKLGVHGTSYGGYATNLLITQTDRFKAAINISGKVDMISFYTDSPRLGVRNITAPERSQDRIGATLWEQPQKYIAHSAVMFADRIDTPLLLMTGQQDWNVPERTTSEMYYALRRLGKRVDWVSYIDGGHGMPTTTEAEVRDYLDRIVGWYDQWLKGSSADNTDG